MYGVGVVSRCQSYERGYNDEDSEELGHLVQADYSHRTLLTISTRVNSPASTFTFASPRDLVFICTPSECLPGQTLIER